MTGARRIFFCAAVLAAVIGVGCQPPMTEAQRREAEAGESLYERDDELEGDRERELGDSADVHGLEATLVAAEFKDRLSDTETSGYIVADVKLENVDSGTTSYDRLDWVLQLPDGTTTHRTNAGDRSIQVQSGEIEKDQSVNGQVVFQINEARGDLYVIYAPRRHATSPEVDRERGVWKVTVE